MPNLPNRVRLYSVSSASKKLGVSITTLRRWDTKGVLRPIRTKGGQRRYTAAQLNSFLRPSRVILSATKDLGPRFFTPVQNDKRSDLSGLLGLLQFATQGLMREVFKKTTETIVDTTILVIVKPIELTQHVVDMALVGVDVVFEGSDKGNKKVEQTILHMANNCLAHADVLSQHVTIHTKTVRRHSSYAARSAQAGYINFINIFDRLFMLFAIVLTGVIDIMVLAGTLCILSGRTLLTFCSILIS